MDHYSFKIEVSYSLLLSNSHGIKIITFVLLILATGLIAFARIGNLGLGRILSMRLVVNYFIIALLVTLLESSSEAYPVLLTFFPGATLITKFVETIKRDKLRELFLVLSLVISLITGIAWNVLN